MHNFNKYVSASVLSISIYMYLSLATSFSEEHIVARAIPLFLMTYGLLVFMEFLEDLSGRK